MKIPAGLEKSNAFVKSDVSAKSIISVKSAAKPSASETAFLNQKNLSPSKPALSQLPMDPLPEKPDSPPGGKTQTAGELLKESAANMGLPKDLLSAGLLAIARFFSLSVNPQLIRALRREILASGKSSSPESTSGKAALESEILARLLAEDKGVVLSSEALERYSAFFGSPGGGKDEELPEREENPAADEIKAIVEEQAQDDKLFDYMNSIPGKNGQYWVMIPFSIKVRGIELKVFIRLLKKEGEKEAFLIADISGPSRQWRCFLKEANGKLRADIRVYPKYSDLALISLQKEAAAFLNNGSALFGNSTDEVLVKNGDSVFSWIDDLYNESTSRASINEEV